jgi:hypothetical protein
MYWPGATGFIRQADCWYGLKNPALRTLASLLLSRAFVVFALLLTVPVLAHAANSPRVQFDTGYLVPCYEVEADDPSEEAVDGERWVEARFRVSALVPEGILDNRVQYMYQFVSPLGSVYVVDYNPRTEMSSNLAGNVGIERKKEASKSLGINLTGSFDQLVRGSGGGDVGVKDTSNVRYELKPRMEVLLASGTINRGTGAYFKLRSSSDTSLEGDREFTMTFRVPSDWRGDIMYLKCEAHEMHRGKLISCGSAHFVLALHLQDDQEVREAAQKLVYAEARLRREVTKKASDIKRRSLPTIAHRVGAILDLTDPRIPDQWLDRVIYGPAQPGRYSFVEYLPYEIQKLAGRYMIAKRRMFVYSGKLADDQPNLVSNP